MPKLAHLDIACDHKGGYDYWCPECQPLPDKAIREIKSVIADFLFSGQRDARDALRKIITIIDEVE